MPSADVITEPLLTVLCYAAGSICLLLFVFGVYQWYLVCASPYSRLGSPPVRPFFGNVLQVARCNTEMWTQMLSWHQQYAKDGVFVFWLLHEPLVNITNLGYIETLLGGSDRDLLVKGLSYDYLAAWLGDGLLTSLPEKWTKRRKLITPSFHFNILQDFVPVFNEFADCLANKFEADSAGAAVDVFPYVKMCALGIITETAMGKRFDEHNSADMEYSLTIERVIRMIMERQQQPWLGNDHLYNWLGSGKLFKQLVDSLHDYSAQIIKQRMKMHADSLCVDGDRPKQSKSRMAFLDALLTAKTDDGQPLTIDDIREEVDTFMFEGHDTVSSGISWSLFLLALNQPEQSRAQQELDEIFGSSTRAATVDDVRAMKYLECVIKESMRIYPPVPLFGRQLGRDVSLDGNKYLIPKGTRVFYYPYIVHRDPAIYPEPLRFVPDRFTDKNTLGRHPYAYLPFSAGPRNCIGQKFAMMEMKIVLSTVLRRFRLTTDLTSDDVPPSSDGITRSAKPLLIKFNVRDL